MVTGTTAHSKPGKTIGELSASTATRTGSGDRPPSESGQPGETSLRHDGIPFSAVPCDGNDRANPPATRTPCSTRPSNNTAANRGKAEEEDWPQKAQKPDGFWSAAARRRFLSLHSRGSTPHGFSLRWSRALRKKESGVKPPHSTIEPAHLGIGTRIMSPRAATTSNSFVSGLAKQAMASSNSSVVCERDKSSAPLSPQVIHTTPSRRTPAIRPGSSSAAQR